MNSTLAVIPVRAGSQRVSGKNFRQFAGKSLLEYKIEVIKTLSVDDIIINTDSEEAISIAKRHGLKYHRREPYFASSECSNSEYHEYLARVTPAENILVAQVTSPLISKKTFQEALDFFQNNEYNSLMSVRSVKEFFWYQDKPLNYTIKNAPNSQDLPEYLSPTFGLVIVKREAMLKSRNYICSKPYFKKVTQLEAIDIDTELDFEFAQFLFQKNNFQFLLTK